MADHSDNGLRAVIKALTDVIAPALDPTDPLAREQLRLAVDYLEFIRLRLDSLYGRERFELRHSLTLGDALLSIAELDGRTHLEVAVVHGRAAYEKEGIDPLALRRATAHIAAAVRESIRANPEQDETTRRAVEATVINHSRERIAFERSLVSATRFRPLPGQHR